MIVRELDANLAGNLLIFGGKYDVTYVKKPKNELALPSVNFLESLFSYRERLYLFNSLFQKIFPGKILL